VDLNLTSIFRCAVELAEAAATLNPSEWADFPAEINDPTGPASPLYPQWMERDDRSRRIEEESIRLKRALGATGRLKYIEKMAVPDPKWENYDERFANTSHDRIVRLALTKLATAAMDLSGFATWREWQWAMRETGLRLLTWGVAQLWEGMSDDERAQVQGYFCRTHRAVGWPDDPENMPTRYDGPDEIPDQDQCRIVSNYVSCYRDFFDDWQKAEDARVRRGLEKFLRQATLGQFVETAEEAAEALKALHGQFDFEAGRELH
jgi:hypothetical protein